MQDGNQDENSKHAHIQKVAGRTTVQHLVIGMRLVCNAGNSNKVAAEVTFMNKPVQIPIEKTLTFLCKLCPWSPNVSHIRNRFETTH